MVAIRNVNDIILSLIDFYKLVKPNLDTKVGSNTRDIFISPLASQLSLLYDELSNISSKQSLRLIIGSDLDKFAKNFGVTRKSALPASGIAIVTFSDINSNFSIRKGDTITSSNGFSFTVNSSIYISLQNLNFYKSIASKYQADLDTLGITDQYAIEVVVTCSTPGISGNLGKYSLVRTNILNASNVFNATEFTGGSDQETDAIFRDRILSIFTGSSIGTSLGYLNATLSVSGVLDAFVVEPGDPLMIRDGTIVNKLTDGTLEIVKDGAGGKVDIIVLGNTLQETTNTFIYLDKSNLSDPTNSKNDYILGQIPGDETKSIKRRRVDNIKTRLLPLQPVDGIVEVSGSLSGSNFKEKAVDSLGRVSGNYELLKDSGYYSGTPWSLDKIHWISDKISDFQEDRIKNQIYGQDELSFTDIREISSIQQFLQISGENSKVTTDRSIIQLLHYPATNVTRVFNTSTGERYIVSNQNLDGSGSVNLTGRIKITGSTLPSSTDVLQVDYTWLINFDNTLDFDGIQNTDNLRSVQNSVDWGYSGLVRSERVKLTLDSTLGFYVGTTTLPIYSIVSCNKFNELFGKVAKVTSGEFVDRLSLSIENISFVPNSVDSIKNVYTDQELYNTSDNNGQFSYVATFFNLDTNYNLSIIFPSDTNAQENDYVSVFLNYEDIFTVDNISGTSNQFTITIPSLNINSDKTEVEVFVNYIAQAENILSSSLTTTLPLTNFYNGFYTSSFAKIDNLTSPFYHESAKIQLNTNLDPYVEVAINSNNYLIDNESFVLIVRVSDNKELWNPIHFGSVTIGTNNNYQFILSGFNSPIEGESVIAVCCPKDLTRFQPVNYYSNLINYRVDTSSTDMLISNFTDSLTVNFSLVDMEDGYESYNFIDGYITGNSDGTAELSSASFLFSSLANVKNFKVKINDDVNYGEYFILDYTSSSNNLKIGNYLKYATNNNFLAIRIKDNKILNISDVDYTNNTITFSDIGSIISPEKTILLAFENKILRNSSSKLSLSIFDQVNNPGTITVTGNTLIKAENILFSQIFNGLKINLNEAFRKALGLNSNTSLPSNIKLVKVVLLEKVEATSNGEVLSVLNTYDTKNSKLADNLYFNNVIDSTLSNLEFMLPNTINNIVNSPTIGDTLRVTFYYVTENDSESIVFTRNSTNYTNKKFAFIKKILVSSGFKNSLSTKLTGISYNQPQTGGRYKVTYDYTAPKQNERIFIRYNYNKLITDVTLEVESKRPINADVLVKESVKVGVTTSILLYIDSKSGISKTTVEQNVSNAIKSVVNQLELGRILDDIDLLNTAEGVVGVDKARIIYFNKTGENGSVSKLVAQNNEYFELDSITILSEMR